MNLTRPKVLSIAGFDPSAGAGILADIKTFEACKVQGLGVISALTIQNQDELKEVKWTAIFDIIQQLEILIQKNKPSHVKIGIIQDLDVLTTVVNYLKNNIPNIKIIWDTVFSASSGYIFHSTINFQKIKSIASKLYLITPNFPEATILFGETNMEEQLIRFSDYCNVYLKGGHLEKDKGKDRLFSKGKSYTFRPRQKEVFPKHGSGCVFSAALVSYLAREYSLNTACLRAKEYTERFLKSSTGNLGYHRI